LRIAILQLRGSSGGPNMKWGTEILNGGPGTTGPPAGDGPEYKP